ncbi:MAG: hypothetical protein GX759_06375 [Thermoanaerobacterales bacterium]|jgi:hypothetical protein|nr:hypothetical protein [Thermoanaerobacterales bacterium]
MENKSANTSKIMASIKNDSEDLLGLIKCFEKQIDDELKSNLSNSSNLIKLNKLLKQINLSAQVMLDINVNEKNSVLRKKLISSISKNIYELHDLLIKDIQKSMLQAVEALIRSENGLFLVNEVENLYRIFHSMTGKVR